MENLMTACGKGRGKVRRPPLTEKLLLGGGKAVVRGAEGGTP